MTTTIGLRRLSICCRLRPILVRSSHLSYQASAPYNQDNGLRKEVTSLYKQMIFLSRGWNVDLKPKIRSAFLKNRDLSDPEEIRKLIAKGEYICQDMIATYQMKKYRAMKKRYYSNELSLDDSQQPVHSGDSSH